MRGGRPPARAPPQRPAVPADVTEVSDLLGFGAAPEPSSPESAIDVDPASRRAPERAALPRREAPGADASAQPHAAP